MLWKSETQVYLNCCYRSIGYEYELILRERLQNRGIPFLGRIMALFWGLFKFDNEITFPCFHLKGEDDMRSRGYDKTPDCKLEIPIGECERYFSDVDEQAKWLNLR